MSWKWAARYAAQSAITDRSCRFTRALGSWRAQACSTGPRVMPFDTDGDESCAFDERAAASLFPILGSPPDSAASKGAAAILADGPRPWDWEYDALAVGRASQGHALYLTTSCVLERLHLVSALSLDVSASRRVLRAALGDAARQFWQENLSRDRPSCASQHNALSRFLWEAEVSYCYDAKPCMTNVLASVTDFNDANEVARKSAINPYHHSGHAADVTAAASHMLCCPEVTARLTATDAFAVRGRDTRERALSLASGKARFCNSVP